MEIEVCGGGYEWVGVWKGVPFDDQCVFQPIRELKGSLCTRFPLVCTL
jgi:hypothetical protein